MGSATTSKLGIHFFYVVLILGLLIVLLITFNWTRLQGFTEYLSVAATVTSLVLGILAIIFGFVSSGTISQSLGAVESAAAKLGTFSQELKSALEDGQKVQDRAEERTDQLHELIGDMRSGLESLSRTTNEIAGSVETMPDRINNTQKMPLRDTDPSPSSHSTDNDLTWSNAKLDHYVRHSSLFGILSLYASLRALESNQYVDFLKLVGQKNYEYVWGFLIASKAANVIALEYPESRNGMRAVRLKNPNDALKSTINARWENLLSSKASRRRRFASDYGEQIDKCLVTKTPTDEDP